mgnify:CR=1 FL=1
MTVRRCLWKILSSRGLVSMSAAISSMRMYETSGFVAVVIPFFSDTWLPEQNDLVEYVTDYRDHYVNTTNGRPPKYFCVRTSTSSNCALASEEGARLLAECAPATPPSSRKSKHQTK